MEVDAWFAETPMKIAQRMGIGNVNPAKLADVVALGDGDINIWYFLGHANERTIDSFCNFVLGPFAVALKERKLPFSKRNQVLLPHGFVQYMDALEMGYVPREAVRTLESLLISRFNTDFCDLVNELPDFTVLYGDHGPVIQNEHFDRLVFYTLLAESVEPLFGGPDSDAIGSAVEKLFADNPDQTKKMIANEKLVGWFVGQVMKYLDPKPQPAEVEAIVKSKREALAKA